MNTEQPKKASFWSRLNIGIADDLDFFIENLSMLVGAGITILEALDALVTEANTQRMRQIILELKEDIESGSPIWKALEKTGLFQPHTVSLIRIGEQTGTLAENLKVIGEQQEKDRMFRSKIRSAMMYPVFVLVLMVFVGVGIAWFILPKLAMVFAQLKLQMPGITKILIGIGIFLSKHGTIAVPLFLFFFGSIVYFMFFFPNTKAVGQTILFHTPGIGKLMKEMEMARFTYLLGTLMNAGLPVVQAIDSLSKATFSQNYKRLYISLKESVESGESFKKSFDQYKNLGKLIPVSTQKMIVAGEKSGGLSETLIKLNQSYEGKVETTTKNLTIILEPIMLVIIWVGVVMVALAVILPIYNLVGQFKTQ